MSVALADAPSRAPVVERRRRWAGPAGLAVYALVASVALLHALPDPAGRTRPDGDVPQTDWFLAWTHHALATGSDPFWTDAVQYPQGVNLLWNTVLPLPGLLASPVTAVWGPVAAHNVLLWAGLVGAMAAMRWCAGAVTRRPTTAWVAGLAYGCSPYVAAQATGHLNLALVVVPPLLARVLLELYTGRRSWLRSGVWLALLATAQFLVTEEVLASAVVVAALTTALLALRHRRTLTRERVRDVARGLGVGAAGSLLLLAWPLAVQLRGKGALSGPATEPVSFAADLLGVVVPSRNQLLHPDWAFASGFSGNATENGSFLGVGLLVLLAWALWRARGAARDWALVALVAFVLSLGGFLRVAGHGTPVKLPFLAVWRLPLLGSLLPARFSLYVVLGVVLALAAASDAWTLPRTALGRAGAAVVALAVAVPLLPSWPYAYVPATVPAWSTGDGVRELARGSVLQTWPVPRRHPGSATSSPVSWQAAADFRYRTTGGHVITRGADGRGTQDGGVRAWERAALGAARSGCGSVPASLLQQVRADWAGLRVTAVVVDPTASGAGQVDALLVRLTGRTADEVRGGVQVWRVDRPAQPLGAVCR
ncbi:MAG: hypothetical protein JWM64_1509 [Frankiales bacterium]|nr:hypothetical protein [Frankiales bacterium]